VIWRLKSSPLIGWSRFYFRFWALRASETSVLNPRESSLSSMCEALRFVHLTLIRRLLIPFTMIQRSWSLLLLSFWYLPTWKIYRPSKVSNLCSSYESDSGISSTLVKVLSLLSLTLKDSTSHAHLAFSRF
jgi:hypothetical protein